MDAKLQSRAFAKAVAGAWWGLQLSEARATRNDVNSARYEFVPEVFSCGMVFCESVERRGMMVFQFGKASRTNLKNDLPRGHELIVEEKTKIARARTS